MYTTNVLTYRLSQLLFQRGRLFVLGTILIIISFIALLYIYSPRTTTPNITIRPANGVFFMQHGTQFTSNGQMIVGLDGNALQFWDAETGVPQHRISIPSASAPLRDVAFNSFVSTYAIAGGDEVFIVDAETERIRRFVPDIRTNTEARPFHSLFANRAVLHPSQPQIATLFYNAYIFNTNTGHLDNEIITGGGVGDAISITYSPDGRYLATGNQYGEVKIWDAKNGHLIHTLFAEGNLVSDLAFDQTGTFLVTANDHTQMIVWNVQTAQRVRTINISPLSEHLLGRRPYANPRNWTTAVDFSPNGNLIAAGGSDASAGVWEIATGKQIVSFQGHTDKVLDIRFSPDGRKIVTIGADGSINVWDIREVISAGDQE